MNLPNKLTVSRLALVVLFVVCFLSDFHFRFSFALAIFTVAAVTDYLDGAIARGRGLVTDFGKLMDPLADKVLTASAFICLTGVAAVPAWAVIVIVSREFLITGLRSLASSKALVIPADQLGKHKTAWQMITVIYFLLLLAIAEWQDDAWLKSAWAVGVHALVNLTVFLTVYSGAAYLWKNRRLIASA